MPDPDSVNPMIGSVLLAVCFLLCNALLAAGDGAFDALGDARIRELEEGGNRGARRIRRMTENSRRYFSRLNAGQCLNALLACAVLLRRFSAPLAMALFGNTASGLASLISAALIAVGTALAMTVFGLLMPRRLAQREPEQAALALAGGFSLLFALLAPFALLVRGVADGLLRLFGIRPEDDAETVTEEDIRELMDAGEELGAIEGAQKDMVNNIFEFDDTTAAELMTPRTDMVAVELDASLEEVVEKAVDHGYSRLPVYEEDIDHILGILYVKDLLPYVGRPIPAPVSIRVLLRETHFVPDTKKCDELFEEMNEKHLQMAIVVDEYGGVAGLITMEDLLESIVGNMQDEFDNEKEEFTQLDESSFIVDGTMNLGDLAERLEISLPEGDYDTVAGFLMDQLGHIPSAEEQAQVTLDGVTLTIREMDDRRIEQVLVHIDPPAEDDGGENEKV